MEDMFELQRKFNKLIGNKIPEVLSEIFTQENIENIKNQTLAIIDEVMEALREIKWKPWKKTDNQFDLVSYRFELIDVFHFLINLFLLAGMTPELVMKYFFNKNRINIKRQRDGY